MIIKSLGPTTSQSSQTILNWLLNKATDVDGDNTLRFLGSLPHKAVAELVHIYQTQAQYPERLERPGSSEWWTYYDYIFVWRNRRFEVTIRRSTQAKVETSYLIKIVSRSMSVEELIGLHQG